MPAKKETTMPAKKETTMPAKKETTLTVLVADKVANGQGGYFRKGSTFEPGKGCDVEALKAKGLVE